MHDTTPKNAIIVLPVDPKATISKKKSLNLSVSDTGTQSCLSPGLLIFTLWHFGFAASKGWHLQPLRDTIKRLFAVHNHSHIYAYKVQVLAAVAVAVLL